jgi:hypothetical protein
MDAPMEPNVSMYMRLTPVVPFVDSSTVLRIDSAASRPFNASASPPVLYAEGFRQLEEFAASLSKET